MQYWFKVSTIELNINIHLVIRSWQKIKLAWTKAIIAFGKVAENRLIDAVPLSEIAHIHAMQDSNSSLPFAPGSAPKEIRDLAPASGTQSNLSMLGKSMAFSGFRKDSTSLSEAQIAKGFTLILMTDECGYNSGRKYYIQTNSDADRREIIQVLGKKCKAAKQSKNAKSRLDSVKATVRRLTTSNPFQYFFAMLIVAVSSSNFHKLVYF